MIFYDLRPVNAESFKFYCYRTDEGAVVYHQEAVGREQESGTKTNE